MGKVFHAISQFNIWVGKNSAIYLTILFTFIFFGGVVSRYVFSAPLKWTDETVEFMFGAAWLLPAAYLLAEDSHIRIDVFYKRFSPRVRHLVDFILFTLVFGAFIYVMVYQGYLFMIRSIIQKETAGSFWNPPLWPEKIILFVSVVMLAVQGIIRIIKDGYGALTGKELES